MSLVVMTMPEKEPAEHCVYVTIKVDRDVLTNARAAAAFANLPLQEWASDALNKAGAEAVGRKLVKRKPPPPPKPRKSKD